MRGRRKERWSGRETESEKKKTKGQDLSNKIEEKNDRPVVMIRRERREAYGWQGV